MSYNFFRPVQDIDYSQKLFTVKYAPKRLEDLMAEPQIIKALVNYRVSQTIPNLILTGPPGTGKRTAVDLLTRSLLGEFHHNDCFYLDGSIDRGKNVVSENSGNQKKSTQSELNIMNFLKQRTSLPVGRFKIIVIYDLDHMTAEAQMALRRIIELQANRVRFIFLANDYTNIIEAIQSRAVIMKFNHASPQNIRCLIDRAISSEKVELPEDLLELIQLVAYGDLKQTLIYLQIMTNVENPSLETFYQIFSLPPIPEIRRLIQISIGCDGKSKKSKTSEAFQILQDMLEKGYLASDILDILFKILIINQDQLPEALQVRWLEAVGLCFYRTEFTGTNHHLYRMISDL